MTQTITLRLTPLEAQELRDLLDWTNDPRFRGLITQIEVANADEMDTPSVDPKPTTQVNES